VEFETWAEERGFDLANMTDTQRHTLEGAWRADQDGGTPPVSTTEPPRTGVTGTEALDRIKAEATQENARRGAITGLVAKYIGEQPDRVEHFDKIGRLAIDGKWDVTRAELELMRQARPDAVGCSWQPRRSGCA